MRICIFGAGAVGGHLAVRLSAAGHQVSCVMRGEALQAVQADGLVLEAGGHATRARVRASHDPADLGPQDLVIVTVKAPAATAAAEGIAPLLGPETPVIWAQNGIPWWYGQGLTGRPPAPDLSWLDPGGRLRSVLPPERVVGGVIYSSSAMRAPGWIVSESPERNLLVIGEPDDAPGGRIDGLRRALSVPGLGSPVVPDIRHVLWSKLLSNMTFSVLCMLTGLTARAAWEDPGLRPMLMALMGEALAVAEHHNPGFTRFDDGGAGPPDHKPSLLVDYQRGRPMEIDALVRAPAAFAAAPGLSTPHYDLLAALALSRAGDAGPGARATSH